MGRKLIRFVGRTAFVVYLCLSVLMPITHCHADELWAEDIACNAGRASDQLPFQPAHTCCELHRNGNTAGDQHHIHFLLDGTLRANRQDTDDISPAPLALSAVDDADQNPFMQCTVNAGASTICLYQDVIRSWYSGLSPPLS